MTVILLFDSEDPLESVFIHVQMNLLNVQMTFYRLCPLNTHLKVLLEQKFAFSKQVN